MSLGSTITAMEEGETMLGFDNQQELLSSGEEGETMLLGFDNEEEEEEVLSFGDADSADVLLTLIPSIDEGSSESPQTTQMPRPIAISTHSETLCRAQYFSDHIPSQHPGKRSPPVFRMSVPCQDATSFYIRCLELLYCEEILPTQFKDVSDALGTLKVAFRISFSECIEPCMCYLAGVSWSPEEERSLRSFFSKSSSPPSQDLADRLGISEHYSNQKVEQTMDQTLVYLVELVSSDVYSELEKDALEVLLKEKVARRGLNSIVLPKSTQMALIYKWGEVVKEFKECYNVVSMQESLPSLLWFFNRLLDCNIGRDAVRVFASDEQLVKMLASVGLPESQALLDLLLRVFGMVTQGKVILQNSDRFRLVNSWLRRFQDLQIILNYCKPEFCSIGKLLNDVIKTLPSFDQVKIFKSYWACEVHKGVRKWPDLHEAFTECCEKLGSGLDRQTVAQNSVPRPFKKRMLEQNGSCPGVQIQQRSRKAAKEKSTEESVNFDMDKNTGQQKSLVPGFTSGRKDSWAFIYNLKEERWKCKATIREDNSCASKDHQEEESWAFKAWGWDGPKKRLSGWDDGCAASP